MFACAPVRYFFNGRTIEIFDGKVKEERMAYPERSWKRAALALVALLPGILLGIPAKFLSYYVGSTQQDYAIAKRDMQDVDSQEKELEHSDQEQKKETSKESELFNLDLIYNSAPGGFVYSLPRNLLESFLSGKAFDHKQDYTPAELQALKADISEMYQTILDQHPQKQPLAIITAGSPGAGKTTLLHQHRIAQIEKGRAIAYICPDDVGLSEMMRTYQKEIQEVKARGLSPLEEKQARLDLYNKYRPGSNAAAHLILAHLIHEQYAFYFGTTASSPATGKFFEFLQSKGYAIKLLHLTAPDDVRWASIQERDQTFIQTTEADVKEKGNLVPQRIQDTYLKFANEIEFFYRGAVQEDAVLAATWIRSQDQSQALGTLTIHDQERYEQIKKVHNAACVALNRPDILWEKSIEENSVLSKP